MSLQSGTPPLCYFCCVIDSITVERRARDAPSGPMFLGAAHPRERGRASAACLLRAHFWLIKHPALQKSKY